MILLAYALETELRYWTPRDGVKTMAIGIGPVEAASAIAAALAKERYELVVNAGIGGAFDGAAEIGDGVVVSDDAIELDLETGAPIVLPTGEQTVERAYSDAGLVRRLQSAGLRALRGITVTRVTSTEETAARLAARGAQVESMEGFAVLRAAERAGVRAIELRGISNRVGDRNVSGWDFEAGARGVQRALEALFAAL
jgi:futalosine hydrolase